MAIIFQKHVVLPPKSACRYKSSSVIQRREKNNNIQLISYKLGLELPKKSQNCGYPEIFCTAVPKPLEPVAQNFACIFPVTIGFYMPNFSHQ